MIRLILLLAQVIPLAAQPEAHFVRIDANGWPAEQQALPQKLEAFERVWSWSSHCAPARIETIQGQPPCAPTQHITIRTTQTAGRPIAGAVVVWGTRPLIEEIPDEFLPRAFAADDGTAQLDIPSAEPVFARIAGPRFASGWRKVEARHGHAQLTAFAAIDAAITALDEHHHDALHVRTLCSPADVDQSDDLPLFITAEKAQLRLRLPAVGASRIILWADDTAPLERVDTNGRIGGTIILPRGCAVRGTVLNAEAKAIGGAGVLVVFPLGKSGHGARRRALSRADGRFDVRGLACGVSVFSIGKKPFAPLRRDLTINNGTFDLGRIVLSIAKTARVLVSDASSGKPVAGARIRVTGTPADATTNAEGVALLDGIGSDEIDIEAAADDYLPATLHLQLPARKPAEIRMSPSAIITATVVRASDHQPAGPGTLSIDLSGTKRIVEFGGDGRVRVAGLRGGTLNLELRVPGLASHKLPQREIAAGDKTDFGTIALDTGGTINGTVLDAATSAPLHARIRLPRPNSSGPRLSVVMKDWIEAATDDNGQFQIRGLRAGDYRLLVEAPGFAPTLTDGIIIDADTAETDVGTIRLAQARRLAIACKPARRCGSKAQLLLGDPNDDWANLSAPISEGKAEILQAPPGRHRLQLLDRGAIAAEKEIVIPDDALETTVEIMLRIVSVSGEVLRGSRPADNGSVQFIGRTAHNGIPIVVDRKVDSTVVDSEVVGIVPRTMIVNVDQAGKFAVDDLAPGSYLVTYSGSTGVSPEQEISIPDASNYNFRINIPATTVTGRIVDQKGRVPDWARVELRAGTNIVSADMAPDGRFSIDGAPSGNVAVHAFNDTAETQREMVIEADRETEIDLMLHEKGRKRITLTALDATGMPSRGARLFLLCDGRLISADADANGSASLPVPITANSCLAAAFSALSGWAFAAPLPISSDAESADATLRFSPRAVTLAINTTSQSIFAISAANGFPLDRTFPFIGWPSVVMPSQPLPLRGLPPGTYVIRLDTGLTRSIVVDGTKDVTVTF